MAGESGGLGSTAAKTAVATVVAAAVASIISWIAGWLPAIWQTITVAAVWIWNLLVLPVPVPLAILGLLVLPFIVRLARAARRVLAKQTPVVAQGARAPPLGDLELGLLRLLAHADGRFLSFEDAVRHLGTSRLLLEPACEALDQRVLIEAHRDILHGAQIALTRPGRDFVIEQGFRLGREHNG